MLAQNYGSGSKWVPATVETQTGPVSYKVKTAGNLLWRRHTDKLLWTLEGLCFYSDNIMCK